MIAVVLGKGGVPREMSDFDRKLLFVTGKGGVGKTTVSATIATALAASGRRVLLGLTEVGRAAGMLGLQSVGTEIEPVRAGLSVVHLDPDAALQEYAELTLRSRSLVRALLDNRYSRGFFAAVPGLHPWAALGKAWYHAVEESEGQARFDTVIVDAPATGHGLEMLRVPLVISQAAAPGILKRDAERAWRMITDPEQTGVVVVSLPEQLPMLESLELIEELRELGLAPHRIVLNARLEELFTQADVRQLEALDASSLGAAARKVLGVARRRIDTEVEQARVEASLRQLPHGLSVLPYVDHPETPAGVERLARAIG